MHDGSVTRALAGEISYGIWSTGDGVIVSMKKIAS
jgi:hypothetical protein